MNLLDEGIDQYVRISGSQACVDQHFGADQPMAHLMDIQFGFYAKAAKFMINTDVAGAQSLKHSRLSLSLAAFLSWYKLY